MSFEYNLLRIFGIFLIIFYFDGTNVLCAENNVSASTNDEVEKVTDKCGNWDEQSSMPWTITVVIELKRLGFINYRDLCEGTLITQNAAITAAQCLTMAYDADDVYIIPGKSNTDHSVESFTKTGNIQAKVYYIMPEYKGYDTNYAGNLAVVVLKKPFQITDALQPICFDRNIQGGENVVYQYGTDKNNFSNCLPKIPNGWQSDPNQHYLCFRVSTDGAICDNIGGGIIVHKKQQFYIRGVIGFTPKKDVCASDTEYGVFINISNYQEYILQILDDHEIKLGDCPYINSKDYATIEILGQNKRSLKPETPVRNYALLKFTCKTNYELRPKTPLLTCLDGNFTNPLPQCRRVLKEAVDDVINVIDDCGNWDETPPAPWNVGFYHKEGNNYKFRCGGSIVTSTVILTASRCITNRRDLYTQLPAEEFYVAAGKYYNDYNAEDDIFAQKSQVKEYYTPNFVGGVSDYKGDLAVVILKNPFRMNNVVQPICLDRNNKIESRQVTSNNIGIVAAWAHTNYKEFKEELIHYNSTYIDNDRCLAKVSELKYHYRRTEDKFCANYITCGNFGAGIAYKWYTNNKQQFYIRGVSSYLDSRDVCDNWYNTAMFTNITYHKEFILKIIDQQLRIDSCPSITLENGQVSVLGQDYTPNESIPNYNLVKLTCNANYSLYPANPLIACSDGEWNVPIPQCKLTCPPAISSSADVTCAVDGNTVDCNEPLVDGAVAISKCKQYYSQSGFDVPISTCVRGTWSNPLIRCVPECGEAISNGVTHVVNGTNTKKGEFPWHVALYRLQGEKYEYQCGGSIINPLIIITAAHCFTDESAVGYPAEEFYFGAGKYYSDYNSAEDKFVQKRHVKEYHIPKEYRGFQSNYAGDLAVVVVRKAFQMTNVVQPVCTDWDGKMESEQLKHNNVGSVVGWGYVDPNIPKASAELKKLNPPFIDQEQCIKEVPTNFRRWITLDKFCAGFLNGSSICKGDSGGGLVFKWNNNRDKYFIRGLVSVGPVQKGICDDFQYGVYTRISFYNNFILNIIAANLVKY